ncbi:hypothetical protein DBY68_016970 [Pseudocitrobacter sp. RIT415]|uniref:hypothetical protein n=1 Tax=Pseudocitrobacter sp. RIT415 TaxID=2202163 RepID=UPI000D379E73|nr:hypothetical protein [Pseudocitrobacter sp. RIT 415]RAU45306.1 hypothetical protein DBY68_016970 [Pseudocitrobacter sp. RIT 415]
MSNPLMYPTRTAVAVFNKFCTRQVTAENIARLAADQPGGYVMCGIRAQLHLRSLRISLALTGAEKMTSEQQVERYKWLGQL